MVKENFVCLLLKALCTRSRGQWRHCWPFEAPLRKFVYQKWERKGNRIYQLYSYLSKGAPRIAISLEIYITNVSDLSSLDHPGDAPWVLWVGAWRWHGTMTIVPLVSETPLYLKEELCPLTSLPYQPTLAAPWLHHKVWVVHQPIKSGVFQCSVTDVLGRRGGGAGDQAWRLR